MQMTPIFVFLYHEYRLIDSLGKHTDQISVGTFKIAFKKLLKSEMMHSGAKEERLKAGAHLIYMSLSQKGF